MPGIYGAINSTSPENDLKNMVESMSLYYHFHQDKLFYDDKICASRVHTGNVGETDSPAQLDNYVVWIEGEAYNVSEVARELNLGVLSFSDLLLAAEKSDQLHKCLNKLDGYFCAVMYDEKKQKVKLISDRYGMRFLYWYHNAGVFAWGSEVKAILAVDNINKKLNQNSFDCFMQLGYLIDDLTWFEHIKLIKPATVVEYDMKHDSVKQYYYWRWSEIKPSSLSFNQAVDKLGELFIEAVSKRFDPQEKIGVSLSGGLDSRVIFAAINHLYPDYKGYAYTFGIPNCDDITIAHQVISQSNNWKHEKFYFSYNNWFEPRFEKVWNTDGMQDMMHMHGSEFLAAISPEMDINLNGYAGDAVLGGSLLPNLPLNTRATKNNTKVLYKDFTILTDISSDFYDIRHVEPHVYMNRVRRFTTYGSINALSWIEQRKPFLDNRVVELVFSLPDDYRMNNKLYAAMLKKYFPKYFNKIPWQQTGKPVDLNKRPSIPIRAMRKAKRELYSVLGIQSNQEYTDYPMWIKDKEVSKQLLDLLSPSNAEYARLTNDNLSSRWLEPHLYNKKVNNANQILRAATIEIYLRQVFRSKNS